MNRILNVMITCRDRTNLTRKVINSIKSNSENFDSINIYLFDNLSEITEKRMNLFLSLLSDKTIQYYSFDTSISSHNCFPKAVAFQRWCKMMITELNINSDISKKNYYALVDNDILFEKNWDRYFIFVADNILQMENNIHYICKAPGGISKIKYKKYKYNIKNEIMFDVVCGTGGSSGFWFMNEEMIKKHLWDDKLLSELKNKFKRHDVMTWRILKHKFPNAFHVCGIFPPAPIEHPLIIHIGPFIGSICNSLQTGKYNKNFKHFKESDDGLENETSEQLFNRFKKEEKARNW